jgi:2-polyprenyl-3-methyl-5-hydroxy-6-metoxy-1,4-benzoquinol methylase
MGVSVSWQEYECVIMERISVDSWRSELGHVYRYNLAASWLNPDERVLDVACGIGYGSQLISEKLAVDYIGADKIEPDKQFADLGRFYSGVNLDEWEPHFEWDVSICFETLEHVANPKHLASQVAKAKRLIIVSVPTRPTTHFNPFHLHDFTVDDVLALFEGHELLHIEDQPEELSHIFVFKGLDA